MRRLLLVLLAVAVLLPAGVSYATPPMTCVGTFEQGSPGSDWLKLANGNVFLLSTTELLVEGCLAGSYGGENVIVIRPDLHLTMHGRREFIGRLAGEWDGTCIFNQVGEGSLDIDSTFTVRATVLSCTGELEKLRGTVVAVGYPDNSGTYSFQYHFDP